MEAGSRPMLEPREQGRLERALGHRFHDPTLARRALTHRSACRDHNERLEFLGDAILGFLVADMLYRHFPEATEGALTRARARLVRRETLGRIARELDLGPLLVLGGGERKSGGRERESILSDALEALLGAIYLDGGVEAARRAVHRLFEPLLEGLSVGESAKDPKSRLQELLQGRGMERPFYQVTETRGRDHLRSFQVRCEIPGLGIECTGEGTSRRQAEQAAAQAALDQIAGRNGQP